MGHRGEKSKRGIKGGNIIQKGIRGLAPCPPAPLQVNSVSPVNTVIGIDPGITGAVVALGSDGNFQYWKMPVKPAGKLVEIDFVYLRGMLRDIDGRYDGLHVYLERAVPFAMGTKSAFNYGRGFAAIEHSLQDLDIPYTLVEPGKWTKVMHAGIAKDWKAKAKSIVAVQRLFPKEARQIPKNKNGKMHEGVMDALLLAGYGQRQTNGEVGDVGDFY